MFTYKKDTHEISRDGKPIGIFDPATGTVGTVEALAPVLKGQLKKLLEAEGCEVKSFALATDSEAEGKEGVSGEGSTPTLPPGDTAPPPASSAPAIPACPPCDPAMGDKTPAVVEWYRDHAPEEFKRRYGNGRRKTHLSRIIRA